MAKQVKFNKNDVFYTPSRYIKPLFSFIDKDLTVYDPAEGAGMLKNVFAESGFAVKGSDITEGKDFFKIPYEEFEGCAIVTNPPYSLKTKFLKHCIEIDQPFALLMPSSTFETKERAKLISHNKIEVITFGERINYIKPDGSIDEGVPFESYWFTYNLTLPSRFYYIELPERTREEITNDSKIDFYQYQNKGTRFRGTFDESLFAGAV